MMNNFKNSHNAPIKLLVFIVFACCFETALQAQSTKEKKDETTWEIGLDILPLIRDTSFHIKESIFLKRKVGENTKLRGRFGMYFDQVKNEDTHKPSLDTVFGHRPRIYTSIGFEKNVFSSSRINLNCGIDGFLFYRRNKIRQHYKTITAIPATDTERFIDDIETKTGINAFVNAEYMITSHLCINIESFWQFAYRRERYFNEEYSFGQLFIYGGRTINRFVTQLQPVSSINIIYKFKNKKT